MLTLPTLAPYPPLGETIYFGLVALLSRLFIVESGTSSTSPANSCTALALYLLAMFLIASKSNGEMLLSLF